MALALSEVCLPRSGSASSERPFELLIFAQDKRACESFWQLFWVVMLLMSDTVLRFGDVGTSIGEIRWILNPAKLPLNSLLLALEVSDE